jgi:hypothetical protein
MCIISRLNAQDPGALPISIPEQRGQTTKWSLLLQDSPDRIGFNMHATGSQSARKFDAHPGQNPEGPVD